MEEERKIFAQALDSNYFEKLIGQDIQVISKNNSLSKQFRIKGNELLRKKGNVEDIHKEIWYYYSKSIATAEKGSEELTLGYNNRSAVLMHMNLFEASILDVNRALNMAEKDFLRVKLLLRKTKCLLALAMPEARVVFEELQSLLNMPNKQSLAKSFEKKIEQINLYFSHPYKPVIPFVDTGLENLNTLMEKHEIDDFSAIEINYSEKYGRYLVAAKDFEPGDVIYIEKPYVRCLHSSHSHTYCSYCFTMTWASIPCEHCSWAMFCSEECKEKACYEYHDIECAVYTLSKESSKDNCKQLALKALILGLKEFGSIETLKNELMAFDMNTDTKKGFMQYGTVKSNGFKTIYNLSKDMSNNILEKHINNTAMVVKSLAISTKLFGDDFEWRKVDNYKTNEKVMFVSSLLLRLSKISQLNGYLMRNNSWDCRNNLNKKECFENECCTFGSYIAPVTSLLNHSCDPNANKCYSRKHTVILYASKPIKKGEQIFDCYTEPFYEKNIDERRKCLSKTYTFRCDCEACESNWPDSSKLDMTQSPVEVELVNEFSELSVPSALGMQVDRDEKSIARYSEAVKIALEKLPYLSLTPLDLISDMQNTFCSIYGLNFDLPSPDIDDALRISKLAFLKDVQNRVRGSCQIF